MLKATLSIYFSIFCCIALLLQGCASSDASRTAAGSIDSAYIGVKSSRSEFDPPRTYQNTSQTTKGVIIGGITGGVIGGITNGIGVAAGVATGAILGGALGAYIDAHTTLVDKLQNRGVGVFILGDQVMIVIPASLTFHPNTSNLHPSAASTLDLVSELIGSYVNISVKVAAYSNDNGNKLIDCSLTQQQAEKVAKYLWKHGVNTRLLFATGYGGTNLVTRNSGIWGSENNRIEITFEKLPA